MGLIERQILDDSKRDSNVCEVGKLLRFKVIAVLWSGATRTQFRFNPAAARVARRVPKNPHKFPNMPKFARTNTDKV